MKQEDGETAARGVIYLVACAANGVVPEAQVVQELDLPLLYNFAQKHMLTAAAAKALKSSGVSDPAFIQAEAKAIRKAVIMDAERTELFRRMNSAGIWHMPLKGSVIQEIYPEYGMREMSDSDILFDETRAADVRCIMEDMGFSAKSFEHGKDDIYYKKPVCNFEMHKSLFLPREGRSVYEYYRDVKRLLISDDDGSCGMHLSDEDFYIFMVAHEHKHFSYAGTGLRSLLDIYIWIRSYGDLLDWDYISRELSTMDLSEFEERNRLLAMRLFGGGELSAEDEAMLSYFVSSGTYGTTAQSVTNTVADHGRLGFFIWKAFPSYEDMSIVKLGSLSHPTFKCAVIPRT